MTREKQLELITEMDGKMVNIMKSKGSDYATEDVLSNFKRISLAAKAIGIDVQSPYGYAMFMVLMKMDRINNLLSSAKVPSNESVADSFEDGINYFKLSYLCYKEISLNKF